MIGFKYFLKNNKGVSLLELVVAVGIFSIVILAAAGIFQAVIEGQRIAIASQNIQEGMRYALEVISKEARMARASSSCHAAGARKVYSTDAAARELYFENSRGRCVAYYLENDRLMVDRGGNFAPLTPASLIVKDLKFVLDENGQKGAAMRMAVESVGKDKEIQKFVLQTFISSRSYER